MKRLTTMICLAAAVLLSGCVGDGYYGDAYYGASVGYGNGYYGGYAGYNSSYCDYYAPPWGYPPDYCRYQIWYQPVFYGGFWYGGPIYYRHYAGHNYYWLHGGWRRDGWRGPRPRIDWNKKGNHFWRGEMRRGRDWNPQVEANGPAPDGGAVANTPRVNERRGRLAREDRERPIRDRRALETGGTPEGGLANAPPPSRGTAFRDNRGGDNVGANQPIGNSVGRSADSAPRVSAPRANRGTIARNSGNRSNIGRASVNRSSVNRSAGGNIGRASVQRGGGNRGPRGRGGG